MSSLPVSETSRPPFINANKLEDLLAVLVSPEDRGIIRRHYNELEQTLVELVARADKAATSVLVSKTTNDNQRHLQKSHPLSLRRSADRFNLSITTLRGKFNKEEADFREKNPDTEKIFDTTDLMVDLMDAIREFEKEVGKFAGDLVKNDNAVARERQQTLTLYLRLASIIGTIGGIIIAAYSLRYSAEKDQN